jgi:[ribosomal protein S5]-alanine N-acetyltransferase
MTDDGLVTTKRLTLRPLVLEDAEDVYAYASDAEVAKYTSWLAHRSLEETERFVASVVALDSGAAGSFRRTWAIRLGNSRQVVGTVDLVQDEPCTARTDFALAQPYWNRGYMTEAVAEVVRLAFERLKIDCIRSGGLTANSGTQRVLEKVGFRLLRREMVTFGLKFNFQTLEVAYWELLRSNGSR